jgi:transposase InsO family protein
MSANVTRFIANSSELTPPRNNNTWVVDSAANAYITPFKSDLRFFVEENIGEVKGFGGRLETALGKGSITLTDVAGNKVTLMDVCYVPSSQDRILSLMKFRREHSVDFQFTGPETFMLTAANGFSIWGNSINDILQITMPQLQVSAVITRSSQKRSLAEISDQESTSDEHELETQKRVRLSPIRSEQPPPLTCSPPNLWHLRYAHASTTSLSKHKSIKSTHDSRKCDICMRAKKTKNPFHRTTSKANTKLGRVHSDICGPYPESEGKANYNLTFLDDVTHYAFSASIPDKSSETVKREFLQFIAAVERETGLKVKSLRSDGGGEYQGDLTPVLQALGVKHEVTPPHTPELNGKAERLNRTLNNSVRAMLLQANMPQSFWAEAMATATYLHNRLPSEAIDNEIPFERWFNKPLGIKDLNLLKPFGCIVWDHVPEQRRKQKSRSKFADKGTRGCFIGYVSSTTYKYWNFERKCFLESHNLTFWETEFPSPIDFQHTEPASTSTPLVPLESSDAERPIYDEITVEQPPIGHAFAIYGPLALQPDPASFEDAMSWRDHESWWKAACDEIQATIKNNTWELVHLPFGKKALPLKWLFKTKRDAKGLFEKHKARIVVKGFSQIAGLDFNETFAPVVRVDSIRIIFAMSAANDLYILHVDCKNAFLHDQNDVELYVMQPEGFVDKRFPDMVLRLNKSLYGLKQAPRIWYLFLCGVIVGLGFVALETDPCIYTRKDIILEVYVDDIKIVGPNKESCGEVFQELAQHVNVESKGPIQSFLGLNVIRNRGQHLIGLNQGAYIDRLVEEYGLGTAKVAHTPLDKSLPLLTARPGEKMCNVEYYQRLTGSLNHLAVFTRPDIAFSVSKLSQFNSNPTAIHLKAALHVLRYLKGSRNLCIVYKRQEHTATIFGHSDSDWASDANDRRSFTGYLFMAYGGPVTWTSHKQTTIAHSTSDAEYMAISDASREALARIQFFQELGLSTAPILILSDSETALDLANGTAINYRKAKHIDIKYHAIRHYIQEDKIQVNHLPGSANIADIFTKALGPQLHQRFVNDMGMRNIQDIIE